MPTVTWDSIINYTDVLPYVIPLICFLIFWNKLRKPELMLFIYFLITFVFNAISDVLGAWYKMNNVPMYHFFTLFEQWYISFYLLYKTLQVFPRKWYFIINISFTIFWAINIATMEPLTLFNSNTRAISSLILMIICLYCIYKLIGKDEEVMHIQYLPVFWITSGFLVYFALSIIIQGILKYYVLQNMNNQGRAIIISADVFIFIKCILVTIGLLFYRSEKITTLISRAN
ncbi:hypothetical protein [Limnovirga soli]|uniref:Uncharacterized protein n=1 Tax=Limnovirga soli TaxID=2656915 RepID=A0A8J8FJD5_9BACT|nr:hypothetical protein [Limnovirga soli]NNV56139.1 hypothetical protein [Limnovirga soli]